MSKVKLNREVYDIEIKLLRVNTLRTDEILNQTEIPPQSIYEIRLTNSFNDPLPSLKLKVSDKTITNLVQFMADGYSYISLKIEYNLADQGGEVDPSVVDLFSPENRTIIEHTFFIDDIAIINQNNINEIIWELTCTSILAPKLQSYTEYSTNALQKTPTTIVREMLKQLNYPYQLLKEYPETNNKINYITPSWFTINQNIRYLLQNSVTPERGLFYLIYNLVNGTGKVESVNDIFSNNEPNKIDNFSIPTKAGAQTMSSFTVQGFTTNNLIKGGALFGLGSPVKFNNFNYLTREHSTTIYDENKIINSFPKLIKELKTTQSTIKKLPKLLDIKKNTLEELDKGIANNQFWYKMDRLFKYTNTCQFNIAPGFLLRDIGRLFTLSCDEPIINSYYGGKWMMGRVDHIMVPDKTYINEITGMRTIEYNYSEDSDGNTLIKGIQ